MKALGDRLVDYLGGLPMLGGDHDGELFEVLPWERRFLRGAFRQPGEAGLSVGRGNGKSALCAGIACAVVDPAGPLHGRRREVVCVAKSFEQARVIYEDVLNFLELKYHASGGLGERRYWRKQDSANRAQLEWRPNGARVRCIGSDPANAHGLRPALVLADEGAQWPNATSERMRAALTTGLGKVPGSKLIALGTRPADDAHWFARLLAAAPYAQIHAAPHDAPPFQVRTLRRANPSWDHLPSLRAQIEGEAVAARRDPDALASFRALRLNHGVSDVHRTVLLDAERWREAMAMDELPASGPYVLGVDVGDEAAMTAAAAYWRSGRLDAFAALPSIPSLAERGLKDGVGRVYTTMAERGELVLHPGRTSSPRMLIAEAIQRWGSPVAVLADRHRSGELLDALDTSGMPVVPVEFRRMGPFDGGEDCADFRHAVLDGHVRPTENLLLTSAVSEARLVTNSGGQRHLAKGVAGGRRLRARDDAAAAAILAVAAGYREWQRGGGERPARLLLGSVG